MNERLDPGSDMTEPSEAAPLIPVADRLAIADLQHSIALATDHGAWPTFLACFVPGAHADYGDLGAGPIESLVERIRESQARYQGTMNVVGTHTARVDGDHASAETYVVSHHFRSESGQSSDDQAGTRYRDELARTPGGWRIVSRVASLRWYRSEPVAPGWLAADD